jgi:hypothetical protein
MSRVTRENRIRNEYVRGNIGVALIVDKIRENGLRLFGHKLRREESNTVRVVMEINVEGKRGKGRPKKRWLDTIETREKKKNIIEKKMELILCYCCKSVTALLIRTVNGLLLITYLLLLLQYW